MGFFQNFTPGELLVVFALTVCSLGFVWMKGMGELS